jgi:hypothetical protein
MIEIPPIKMVLGEMVLGFRVYHMNGISQDGELTHTKKK